MRQDGSYTSRELPVTAHLIHMTQDGRPTWISAMEDTHLINTIRFFCRGVKELTARLDDTVPERSTRARHMYGEPEKIDSKQYQKVVVGTQAKIAPYVIEAVIRALPEVRDILTEAFGRQAKDPEAPTPDRRAMGTLMWNKMKSAHTQFGPPSDLKRKLMAKAQGETFERPEELDDPMDMESILDHDDC